MGRRVGQLAGGLAFFIGLARLGRLLEPAPGSAPWQLILIASALLGGVAWWLLTQLISNRIARLALFALGGLLLALRITAPTTLVAGFLPSASTPPALGAEFGLAWRTIESGIPPVEPFAGLLAILAVMTWVIGAFFTWGSLEGPNAALFLPSLIMYFQFAVFDRADASVGWLVFSTIALGMSVVSLSLERREDAGRARDAEGRPLARRSVMLAMVMASIIGVGSIALASSASDVINEYGNAPWRQGTGLGPGPGGGVTYDGLVELRQRILDPSNAVVFTARLADETPDDVRPYWRVDALDTFNGVEWSRSDTTSRRYESGSNVVDQDNLYTGTTVEILQTVRINALNSILAPTAGTPIEIQDPAGNVERPRFANEFYEVGGVSIGVSGGLSRLDQYQLRTSLTDRTADLGALATDPEGELSPIFAAAAADGEFPYQAREPEFGPAVLADPDRYLDLPENTPAGIINRARSITAGKTTDFEAAWMLQSWFRDQGNFEYNIDVTTGHSSLVLDDWLNDSTSVNYRKGYCEQFAAAMGVLARTIGIPSRVVWGFTPGEVDEDGIITVRDTNAHAWVELWIEPYGWYPFDPTPRAEQTGFDSQPPSITAGVDPREFLAEPEDNPTTVTVPPGVGPESLEDLNVDTGASTTGINPRWWLIGLAALIPLAGAVPFYKRMRRRRRLARVRHGDITAAWDEIVDRLTDLGMEVSSSLTPLEVARSTNHALLPLAYNYCSTVYGGRSGQARESDLTGVEGWLDTNYDGARRAKAAFSLRSLIRR